MKGDVFEVLVNTQVLSNQFAQIDGKIFVITLLHFKEKMVKSYHKKLRLLKL